MPKGSSRSGPPPDPNALRRDREGDWVSLPAAGRKGATPRWPLSKQSARERTLWVELWKRPQAVEWERQQQHLEVAMLVRRLVEAERPGSPVAVSTLVRQMWDSLGLTTPGLRFNRWKIAADVQAVDDASSPDKPAARDRFRVVSGGG
jgi:hypothetical protein